MREDARPKAGLLLQARGPGSHGALALAGSGVATIGGLTILTLGASLFLGSLGQVTRCFEKRSGGRRGDRRLRCLIEVSRYAAARMPAAFTASPT